MKTGLFPLSVVLFPGSVLSLHIFEDRYKELVSMCLETGEEFGINLMLKSKMRETGCRAAIREVLKKYEDGRYDIVVEGTERYRLAETGIADAGYMTGETEPFPDRVEERNETLEQETVFLYNRMTELLQGIHMERINSDFPEGRLSFFMAQKAGLTLEQRQLLLENDSENSRLEYMKKHLSSISPLMSEAAQLQRIIMNDGYLKPKFLE